MIEYLEDPHSQKIEYHKLKLPKSKTHYAVGDKIVETGSSILPGMKWAADFLEGKEGSKPVKFIENCSLKNRENDIFDHHNSQGGNKVNKNGHIGLNCVCEQVNPKKPKEVCNNMNHSKMLNDPYVLQFLGSSIMSNQSKSHPTGRFHDFDEA